MLTEQIICGDGAIRTKLEIAIQRLKTFEPPEGYFVAFSGAEDVLNWWIGGGSI